MHSHIHGDACAHAHTHTHTHTFTWARTAMLTQVKDTHWASHPFLSLVQLPTEPSRSGVTYRALSTIRIVLTCNLDRIHTLAFQKEICGSIFACQVSEFHYFTRISEPLKYLLTFHSFLKILKTFWHVPLKVDLIAHTCRKVGLKRASQWLW